MFQKIVDSDSELFINHNLSVTERRAPAGHGGFDAPGWRDRRWQVAVGTGVEKYATGRGVSPWRHPGPEYEGLAGASAKLRGQGSART